VPPAVFDAHEQYGFVTELASTGVEYGMCGIGPVARGEDRVSGMTLKKLLIPVVRHEFLSGPRTKRRRSSAKRWIRRSIARPAAFLQRQADRRASIPRLDWRLLDQDTNHRGTPPCAHRRPANPDRCVRGTTRTPVPIR